MELKEMDFGTETSAVEQYIEDLQINLIDACTEAMRTSHQDLEGQISQYWSGVSAQRFLNSYAQTINSAENMFAELKKALNNYILDIKNGVLNTEASLWTEAENPFGGSADPDSYKWTE